MKVCSVGGCERKVHARQLCSGHYQQWLYRGSPEGPAGPYTDEDMPAEEIQKVSAALDAACPRFILILHPNFKLPEGFRFGEVAS